MTRRLGWVGIVEGAKFSAANIRQFFEGKK